MLRRRCLPGRGRVPHLLPAAAPWWLQVGQNAAAWDVALRPSDPQPAPRPAGVTAGARTAVALAVLLAALLALPPLAAAGPTLARTTRVNGTCGLLGCRACKATPGALSGATLAMCTKCLPSFKLAKGACGERWGGSVAAASGAADLSGALQGRGVVLAMGRTLCWRWGDGAARLHTQPAPLDTHRMRPQSGRLA